MTFLDILNINVSSEKCNFRDLQLNIDWSFHTYRDIQKDKYHIFWMGLIRDIFNWNYD